MDAKCTCPHCKEDKMYPHRYGTAYLGVRLVKTENVKHRIGMYKIIDARVDHFKCYTCEHEWKSEPYWFLPKK